MLKHTTGNENPRRGRRPGTGQISSLPADVLSRVNAAIDTSNFKPLALFRRFGLREHGVEESTFRAYVCDRRRHARRCLVFGGQITPGSKRRGRSVKMRKSVPPAVLALIRSLAVRRGLGASDLYARFDIEKYGVTLRTLSNHLDRIRESHGIGKRPGVRTETESLARLVLTFLYHEVGSAEVPRVLDCARELWRDPTAVAGEATP
ncbi:MAG: hypothetical protein V3T70_05715 [Phycisphaerae bacterium]